MKKLQLPQNHQFFETDNYEDKSLLLIT